GSDAARIDPLRYGSHPAGDGNRKELAWLRLRYKLPGTDHSRLIERAVTDSDQSGTPSRRLRFAAAVAAFAESLRGAKYLDNYTLPQIATLARGARGDDPHGYRASFVRLVELAEGLRTLEPQSATKTVTER
ncbi:MAG: YfbK domain-containing protein, partial [Rhodanobacteraceae bacterium]